jgi:hypothetical protein
MQLAHGLARSIACAALAVAGCYGQMPEGDPAGAAAGRGGARAGTAGRAAAGGATGAGTADLVPAPATLRLLTERQLRRSLTDLLGASASVPADLSLVDSIGGLAAVSASRVALAGNGVERMHGAALALAHEATTNERARSALVPCTPASTTDEGCLRTFVTTFGRRAYRRPLDGAQTDRLIGVARAVWTVEPDFWRGVEGVLAAMLQSPYFLYRAELGRAGAHAYDDWELASRLSFFLWDATPDAELLDRAAAGRLRDADALRAQVDRLLASPRAHEALGALFGEALHLDELDGVTRAPERYPAFTPALRAAMRAETLALFDDVALTRAADVRELYDARTTFVNDELAKLYGLPPPGATTPTRTTLPANGPRAGVLTHASLLTIGAHATMTSPTLRGRFVRENVLCGAVPSPPPGINTNLPESNAAAPTMRERLAQHRREPSCAACHALMDPLGLPFETFDPIGAYRSTEGGQAIDPSGDLDGSGFADAAELARLLRRRPEPAACLARMVFRSAAGHVESDGEEPAVAALIDRFAADGHSLPALVRALVGSDLFRRAGEVP